MAAMSFDRKIVKIPLSSIRVDEKQPRKEFEGIDEFATSLEVNPSIEMPIIVEDLGRGSYFLVDGERRFRAAQKAGLEEILADVRKSLSDVDREVIRGRINFQRKAWKEGESLKFINKLYDDWLRDRFNEKRGSEAKGRRKQFAQLIGIGDTYLTQLLGLDQISSLMGERKISTHAAEHISNKSTEIQREIINEAEAIRQRANKPKITRPILRQAREEVEIKRAPSKADKNREAYVDIVQSFRRMTGEAGVIRDRLPFVYNADTAREVLEMADSLGKTVLDMEDEIMKRFPAIKPRRVSK